MTFTVALAQLNSQPDIHTNLKQIENAAVIAQRNAVQLLLLPENAFCMAGNQHHTAQQFYRLCQFTSQLCIHHHLWIVVGSMPCMLDINNQPTTDKKLRSACMVFNDCGVVVARYDKIHLFDALVADGIGQYQESVTFGAGHTPVVVPTPWGNMGLIICYDLRFAELIITLRQMGADFIVSPAAFTFQTGQLHWQTLISARALDSQCFVLVCNQTGTHGQNRQTWGHSAVVNANGHIVAQLNQQPDVLIYTLDFSAQNLLRKNIPIYNHRKASIYFNP